MNVKYYKNEGKKRDHDEKEKIFTTYFVHILS